MFLTEKELKDTFWKNYNYSGRAVRYQFECPIREGNADLITAEVFQDAVQINAFEFKLSDIKKALLQAKGNIPFANKSWIVIPMEKTQLITDRYENQLKSLKYIGVIAVEAGGRWEMVHKPHFQKDIKICQPILKMLLQDI